jgi:hypothetical protein
MNDSFDKFLEQGEQRSPEWLAARVGFTSASRFKDVVDKLKSGKPGAKREAYFWEKVIERLTGQPATHYESVAMQWGTENEAEARQQYEAHTGALVEETGFIHHPTLEWVGGSPDGKIDSDGVVEIKNPFNSANHLQCFLTGFPEEHRAQTQGLLWLMDRQWVDCMSYDRRLPAPLNLYIERQQRDEEYCVMLEAEVTVFNSEVAAMVEKLKAIK